jgi:hypothetical protein
LIPLYIDDKTNVAMHPPPHRTAAVRRAVAAFGFGRRIKALTGSLPCIGGMEACGRRGLQINDAWI